MATRGVAIRTCTPVASTLRRRSGAAAPAAARRAPLLDSFVSQDFIATWGTQYNKSLRDTLERSRKQEEVIRRGIKWFSRGLKTAEWACYFGVSAAVAATLAVRKP